MKGYHFGGNARADIVPGASRYALDRQYWIRLGFTVTFYVLNPRVGAFSAKKTGPRTIAPTLITLSTFEQKLVNVVLHLLAEDSPLTYRCTLHSEKLSIGIIPDLRVYKRISGAHHITTFPYFISGMGL